MKPGGLVKPLKQMQAVGLGHALGIHTGKRVTQLGRGHQNYAKGLRPARGLEH